MFVKTPYSVILDAIVVRKGTNLVRCDELITDFDPNVVKHRTDSLT